MVVAPLLVPLLLLLLLDPAADAATDGGCIRCKSLNCVASASMVFCLLMLSNCIF